MTDRIKDIAGHISLAVGAVVYLSGIWQVKGVNLTDAVSTFWGGAIIAGAVLFFASYIYLERAGFIPEEIEYKPIEK